MGSASAGAKLWRFPPPRPRPRAAPSPLRCRTAAGGGPRTRRQQKDGGERGQLRRAAGLSTRSPRRAAEWSAALAAAHGRRARAKEGALLRRQAERKVLGARLPPVSPAGLPVRARLRAQSSSIPQNHSAAAAAATSL